MLTKEAFNALLKTLEEPPEHVKFIFCTTEVEKVPITIRSRCQRFDFAGIDTAAIADRLSSIAQEEQVTAEDGAFDILARRAAGSMRDAQSLLEQLLSFAPEHITLADVHGMLGTANDQLLFRLLEGVLRCDGATIFAELDAAVNDGVDLGVLMEQLLQFFRDLLVAASGGSAKLLLFCSPTQWEETKLLAEQFGLHRILASMQILDQTYSKMRYSTQGRILTELALIRLAQLEQVQMISVLLEQLKGGTPATVLTSVPQTVKPVQRALPAPPRPETPWSAPEVPVRPLPSNAAPDVHSYLGTNTKVSTPQDRLAAAAPRSVGLDDMTNEKAKQIWDEMLEEVPGMLGRCAGDYRRLRFEPPNVFWIEFAKKISKDYCETNSAQLRSLLNRVIGKAVQLRFLLVDAPEEPKKRHPETSTQRTSSAAEQGAMLRAAAKNSLVRTIEEIFGAELEDVV